MIEILRNKRIYDFEVTYLSDNFNKNEDEKSNCNDVDISRVLSFS
jgi:hypothetical protein